MSHVSLHVAARICGVKPGTIRRWVHDGRITRHCSDGYGEYDKAELLAYVAARNLEALKLRAGLTGDHRGRMGRSA